MAKRGEKLEGKIASILSKKLWPGLNRLYVKYGEQEAKRRVI